MTVSKGIDAPNYYWCLEHNKVEESIGCGSTTRIGPYATASEAAGALDRARKRKAEQEQQDDKDKW